MTMAEREHVIWDSKPDFEDWEATLREEYPTLTQAELYKIMLESNSLYLDDERRNLSGIILPNGICAVADLGLWFGRRQGVSKREFAQISDCLCGFVCGDSYLSIYVDAMGELRTREAHHDGTNYYWFRAWKSGVKDAQKDYIHDLILSGKDYEASMRRLTFRLGDLIGDVYGWTFAHRPKAAAITERRPSKCPM